MAADGSVYEIHDAAAIVGVDEAEVRRWVRSRVVVPSEKRGRRRLFSFADLIALKAARELFARGVSLRAVKRNLAALSSALPSEDDTAARASQRALTRLRVVSDGERLVVVADDVVFEPLSGQVVMEFVVGALSHRAAEVMALPRTSPPPLPAPPRSAWACFHEALALDEAGRGDEAEAGYRSALELDPALATAHTNLGTLAWRAGRRGEARERFERALALEPEQPEARFNLANLLDELGETAAAVAEWTRVAALAPTFADAHFNLGAALAGDADSHDPADLAAARAHLERYLALTRERDDHAAATETARALLRALASA